MFVFCTTCLNTIFVWVFIAFLKKEVHEKPYAYLSEQKNIIMGLGLIVMKGGCMKVGIKETHKRIKETFSCGLHVLA